MLVMLVGQRTTIAAHLRALTESRRALHRALASAEELEDLTRRLLEEGRPLSELACAPTTARLKAELYPPLLDFLVCLRRLRAALYRAAHEEEHVPVATLARMTGLRRQTVAELVSYARRAPHPADVEPLERALGLERVGRPAAFAQLVRSFESDRHRSEQALRKAWGA